MHKKRWKKSLKNYKPFRANKTSGCIRLLLQYNCPSNYEKLTVQRDISLNGNLFLKLETINN
jgi:hypothetical protein